VRSRLLTVVLTGVAGSIWSGTSGITLRFNTKRVLSFRCWIFGHEDWVRRVPGRLYLECLDCGRETPGWTTTREQSRVRATSATTQAISKPPDCSASDASPSTGGLSGPPKRSGGHQHGMPIAA
jgi:hypothetical protein